MVVGGTCVCVVGESVLVVVVVVARAVMTVDPMKLALQSERSRDDDLDAPRGGVRCLCRCCFVMIVLFVSSFVPRGAERDEPFSS